MFAEDAQEEYQYEASPVNKLRLEICNARHVMAERLLEHIEYEMSLADSLLKTDSTHSKIVLESFVDWAFKQYGVDIIIPISPPKIAWEDVKIKIYEDFKIGLFIKGKPKKYSHFRDIGLMGKRKNTPNNLGTILIGLSQNMKYPPFTSKKHHRTAISKLRLCLRKFSGVSADPFNSFKECDGWIPCFELIDDRRNADERAKKEATHISYDDYVLKFDDEDDDTGNWLRDNQKP
jgi:hypothetical protein